MWVLAQIVALADQGLSCAAIASNPRIKKQDGTSPTRQGVQQVLSKQRRRKAKGKKWLAALGSGKGGGRPAALNNHQRRQLESLVKKERFRRVLRVPWLIKKTKLKCSRWTVWRAVSEMG